MCFGNTWEYPPSFIQCNWDHFPSIISLSLGLCTLRVKMSAKVHICTNGGETLMGVTNKTDASSVRYIIPCLKWYSVLLEYLQCLAWAHISHEASCINTRAIWLPLRRYFETRLFFFYEKISVGTNFKLICSYGFHEHVYWRIYASSVIFK